MCGISTHTCYAGHGTGNGLGVPFRLMGSPFLKHLGFEPSFSMKTSVTQGGWGYSPRVNKEKTEEQGQ